MKEKPILFNTDMVQAILSGRKTQTRRVLDCTHPVVTGFEPNGSHGYWKGTAKSEAVIQQYISTFPFTIKCPFGVVGERLWVRETFTQGYEATLLKDEGDDMDAVSIIYKADGKELYRECPKEVAENWGDWSCDGEGDPVFKPSIHMPRWASRLLLEITAIRVERLNDISEQDAQTEGVEAVSVPDNVPVEGGYTKADRAMWKGYQKNERAYRDTAKDSFLSLWQSVYGAKSWSANPWVWVVEFKVIEPTDKA